MQLKNVKYLISVPSKDLWLDDNRNEICFIGRSNVGKSTLINKITNNNNMAKVSKTPGYTKYLNFFDVDNKYYLVDTPGYGYAKVNYNRDQEFEKMMSDYIYKRDNLKCVIMLVDCKVGFTSDDILMLDMLKAANRKIQIIASKYDKTNQSERHKFKEQAKELLNEDVYNSILFFAKDNQRFCDEVVKRIYEIYENDYTK